jgi:hypothetical protein
MPVDVVTVDRIDCVPTRKPACMQYWIVAHTVAYPSQLVRYQTVDHWRASLCEQAKVTGLPLQVTWRDHRFGRELVSVEIASE